MSSAAPSVTLLTSNAGQVYADPAGFVRICWSGQLRTLAETQALLNMAAATLARYGWGRILVDQTHMQPFSPQEQLWVAEEWLPAAVQQSGYRFGAVVVSTNVLTRLATAYVTTSFADLPLRYRSFDAEAAAVVWLLRQPQ
jgi:hypothetical protein